MTRIEAIKEWVQHFHSDHSQDLRDLLDLYDAVKDAPIERMGLGGSDVVDVMARLDAEVEP